MITGCNKKTKRKKKGKHYLHGSHIMEIGGLQGATDNKIGNNNEKREI